MCGIIIKYGMVISLLSCIAHQTMAQYAGKVFVDENKNGLFDKGEKLLQDVSVSDGLKLSGVAVVTASAADVVLTQLTPV